VAAEQTHTISPPSVVDEVVSRLQELILSGSLAPGERLVEERLTERFGVSRPPVREALRILQENGLVESIPCRGCIVTPLNADDVQEIYSLRWALERLALELLVPVDDPARLDPLRAALESIRKAAAEDDEAALLQANLDFHLTLCEITGHSRLIRAYRALLSQLQLCMAMNLRFRARLFKDSEDAVRRHERLLHAIEGGDLEKVLAEVEVHGDKAFLSELQSFLPPPPD
jgi:DNA-binding GntR family transcriptional regulator